MAFFQNLPFKVFQGHKKNPNPSGIDPSLQSQQPVKLNPDPIEERMKQIELEIEAKKKQAQVQPHIHRTYPHQPVAKPKGNIFSKIFWTAILLSIPAGIIWIANLPYPIVRRPVARNAPMLLLPSYMSMDNHFRQALVAVKQAEQLIEKPTSPADLELGGQKVKEAQKHLDALPLWFMHEWSEYNYWWYNSYLSFYGFNSARSKIGELQAKVFQENNAQTLLIDSEQALNTAKQQYQQAKTPIDKKSAIAAWQVALNKLAQIPGQTLAGKTAQTKLEPYQKEFQEVVGLVAGNERISTLITAARQFSWQAAKAAQNPPHREYEWQEIENLWEQAIKRLKQIPPEDLTGYAEAQKLMATYEANLAQVKIRKQAENVSVQAFEQAQREIENLLASVPSNPHPGERNSIIGRLQSIINQLEKVQNGTTVYLQAQDLLLKANNKLQQMQVK
ncbi:MAG: hypothetical protein VKL59_01615 [Nostocaceae cyanobacterium]|nr:hypothetical protein [Nostocaceae cyanobacterium]